MPSVTDPEMRQAIADRIRFYNDLGIYDFYRREPASSEVVTSLQTERDSAQRQEPIEEMPRSKASVAVVAAEENSSLAASSKPEAGVQDPVRALQNIRAAIGDSPRCQLPQHARTQILLAVGNQTAAL